MDTVIIPRDARLSRHENALFVISDAGRKAIPLNGVKHVVCMGDGSISIRLLKDMGRRGIRFTVLDAGGRFLGAFEPEDETPSGRVRVGQAALILDEVARLRIAKQIVATQVRSMRGLLSRYRRNGTMGLEASLEGMTSVLDLTKKSSSIEALMGAEGQARAFLHYAFKVISKDARLDRRIRRPPPNPPRPWIAALWSCRSISNHQDGESVYGGGDWCFKRIPRCPVRDWICKWVSRGFSIYFPRHAQAPFHPELRHGAAPRG